jgi:hypothetical protein
MHHSLTPEQVAVLTWRNGSLNNGYCVDVADTGSGMAVRNSENPNGPILLFSREETRRFFAAVKDGKFDDLI